MLETIWCYLQSFLLIYAAVSLLTYLVPFLLQTWVYGEQDLKLKYKAKWALVTGASTGIGRAITEKLAKQGINVVLVALDDQFLKDFFPKLQSLYPNLEFRRIGIDLSKEGYMQAITKETEDITISLVFNNAGFITVGLFPVLDLERQMKNMEVNLTCAVRITHHFVNKMMFNAIPGAVIFTSSPAGGCLPSPSSVMYASTKGFITRFAQSLAGDVKGDGIDVLVIHPSPVDTNFYKAETAHKSDFLLLFKKAATSPKTIADAMFSSVGRTVVRDQGLTAFSFRILLKFIDTDLFTYITAIFTQYLADYKRIRAEYKPKKS